MAMSYEIERDISVVVVLSNNYPVVLIMALIIDFAKCCVIADNSYLLLNRSGLGVKTSCFVRAGYPGINIYLNILYQLWVTIVTNLRNFQFGWCVITSNFDTIEK